jgi:hypothetical protein
MRGSEIDKPSSFLAFSSRREYNCRIYRSRDGLEVGVGKGLPTQLCAFDISDRQLRHWLATRLPAVAGVHFFFCAHTELSLFSFMQ